MTKYLNTSVKVGKESATELSKFNVTKQEETNVDGRIVGEYYKYSPKEMQLEVDWKHSKVPANFQKEFENKHKLEC